MNTLLTPQHEDFVRLLVESGLYDNIDDVFHEALRLLELKEKNQVEKITRARDEVRMLRAAGRRRPDPGTSRPSAAC